MTSFVNAPFRCHQIAYYLQISAQNFSIQFSACGDLFQDDWLMSSPEALPLEILHPPEILLWIRPCFQQYKRRSLTTHRAPLCLLSSCHEFYRISNIIENKVRCFLSSDDEPLIIPYKYKAINRIIYYLIKLLPYI